MNDDAGALRALLECEAMKIGERMADFASVRSAQVVKIETSDALISIAVIPGGARAGARLSPCERDILLLLSKATGRMTTSEILDALARCGIRWSEATVKKYLSRLANDLGYIESRRRTPCGYRLLACPILPEFRQLPPPSARPEVQPSRNGSA
jgi:hypothetical protein